MRGAQLDLAGISASPMAKGAATTAPVLPSLLEAVLSAQHFAFLVGVWYRLCHSPALYVSVHPLPPSSPAVQLVGIFL